MEYQRASAATSFSKKLSNGHSFNGKSLYDGVFGGQTKVGSAVEDYAEIFGGGSGSSIPFLDVPELNQRKFSVEVSSSKLDYSNIFGGFGDVDFAVSHEEFVAKPTRDKKRPAKTKSHSEGSFSYPSSNRVVSNDEASHGSSNGVKQFKMSYNKSSLGSKNGTNGTIDVAVPGFTCVVDENIAPPREDPVSSAVNEPYGTEKLGGGKGDDGVHCEKPASDVQACGVGKETLKGVDQFHSEPKSNGSDCNDVLFGTYDFGHGTPPSKVKRASSMSYNNGVNNRDSLKFGVPRSQSLDCDMGVSSPPYFDDELDVNSVAATSAAAVKKAIEEAQARLKVAKEIMERRKGYMGRVKPRSNGSSTSEERKKSKDTVKQNNFREDKAQETSEKIVASQQTSDGVKMQNVIKVHQVAAELEDEKRGFVAREAAGETCAKDFISLQADCRQDEVEKREAAKDGEREKDVTQDLNEHEGEEKTTFDKPEEYNEEPEVVGEATELKKKIDESREFFDNEECLHESVPDVEFHDTKEDETELRFGEQWEETEENVCNELEPCERKSEDPEQPIEDEKKVEMEEVKDTDDLERLTVAKEGLDMEEKHQHKIEQEENVSEKEKNEMLLEDVSVQEKFEEISEEAFEISELKEEVSAACRPEENNEEEDACDREDNEQMSDKTKEPVIIDPRDDAFDHEEEMRKLEENGDSLGNEEFMEAEENVELLEDAYQMEAADEGQMMASESVGTEEVQNQTNQEADEMTEAREDALDCYWEDLKVADNASNSNEFNYLGETLEPSISEDSCEMTPEFLCNEENEGIVEGCKAYSECKETEINSEADEMATNLEENLEFDKSDLAESNLKPDEIKWQAENTADASNFERSSIDVDPADVTFEKDHYERHSEKSEKTFTMEKHVEELACKSEDVREAVVCLKQEENKYSFEHTDEVRFVDSQLHCEFGDKNEATQIGHEIEAGQSTEYEEENSPKTLMKEERETENASEEEVKLVREEQKRVDEAKERERKKEKVKEKEKERIAVERAIREARERAFAEARERAAAGRTNIEAQRKVKAETTQGESVKHSADTNDKTFREAKLKAERAAVERATAEARQRALEKALSEKASLGARNQAEKFSDSKHSYQSYDSRYKGSCPPGTSRYPNSSNQSASKYSEESDGAVGESAQRCKARLERHQRTAERAAKALAEKNERDLLAQKEQAERNRLAETLDAEVKRWLSGKQGNLRALLSTLQYILGPDSGWQPISLTDILGTAAVKKAYRKATLCVHPDKLQQRGANIQQKYICEKVFDLLKEAWNRFSAEER
ncbi:hypothetical protein ES319_D06G008900v1 [Gossypium barbadense]|uniref:J domain-containing protein n=1 Tax=Gossypium barbadense TaxID=3634 RepID=A0A5J5QZK9_GOSBA|nr:hypothetical protein ES319_D06G008900v1 [Gossypium barbadense]